MFPIKRRRGDGSPSRAYTGARAYASSRRWYEFYTREDNATAPHDPRAAMGSARPSRRLLGLLHERRPRAPLDEDDVERLVHANVEYSRELADDLQRRVAPRTSARGSPVTPAAVQAPVPGRSHLLHVDPSGSQTANDRHHRKGDDDTDEEKDPRSRWVLQSSRSELPHESSRQLAPNQSANASREATASATSTPMSETGGYRDSVTSLSSSDAAPVQPLPRNRPMTLMRTESASSLDTATATSSYDAGARTLAKSSRYLREIDRRNILQRIENGEKQATLAKEYQVSRAAICNLNKHRDVVLSRKDENPLAKHPKKPRPKGLPARIKITSKSTELLSHSAFAYEMKTRSIALLLTLLRSPATNTTDFRRYADRILRLIVEEALALVPFKHVHVCVSDVVKIEGVRVDHPACGVALEPTGGNHLLRVFHAIEPQEMVGSIRVRRSHVEAVHLPEALHDRNVFLFDLFTYSGETVTSAIATLTSRGARENCTWLVSLCVAYEVAELIHTRFPHVKVITAQIDRSNMPIATAASLSTETASATTNHETTAQTTTKPDIPTKLLVKRFLQAYEPKPTAKSSDPRSETEATC